MDELPSHSYSLRVVELCCSTAAVQVGGTPNRARILAWGPEPRLGIFDFEWSALVALGHSDTSAAHKTGKATLPRVRQKTDFPTGKTADHQEGNFSYYFQLPARSEKENDWC